MTTINGRTPEEIKLGLVHCLTAREYRNCLVCPYGTPRKCGMLPCDCEVRQDILALIDQLQEDKKQLERERDAAVSLLDGECFACLYNEDGEPCRTKEVCQCCVYNEDAWGMDLDYNWQWRGVQGVE